MQTARTTVELDKELLKKAKQKAIEEDKSLKQIMNEILRRGLERAQAEEIPKRKRRIRIRTYPLGVKGKLTREEIYDWF